MKLLTQTLETANITFVILSNLFCVAHIMAQRFHRLRAVERTLSSVHCTLAKYGFHMSVTVTNSPEEHKMLTEKFLGENVMLTRSTFSWTNHDTKMYAMQNKFDY
jgi:hypothetical protein